MIEVPHNIGHALRRRRVESGETQASLAAALGVTQGYVSRVEAGAQRVSLATLMAWCDFLEINTLSVLGAHSCPMCHREVA